MLLRTGTILAAGLLFATLTQAATLRFNGVPNGSKIKIDGTSTVHDWTVHCELVPGFMEIETDAPVDTSGKSMPNFATIKSTPKVQLTIPVRSIKSDKKTMDEVMHGAMKESEFPKIEYRLTEWSLKEAPKTATGPAVFNTKGDLTVSGVKKSIQMPVTLQAMENNRLKASGQVDLKMTDFGIKPPAPVAFLIKTADDVKVTFEWLTALKSEAK